MAVIDLKNASIFIHDLTGSVTISGTPLTACSSGNCVEVKIGEGNLTYSEKRAITYVKDRGRLDTCKLGDEDPVEVSLNFTWEFLRAASGGTPTVEEAFKKIGEAEGWESSSADPCEPYAVDVVVAYVPPCAADYEVIVLEDFRWESLDHDLKTGQVAVKGNCNVLQATVTHTHTG